jgi:hypothetical protein
VLSDQCPLDRVHSPCLRPAPPLSAQLRMLWSCGVPVSKRHRRQTSRLTPGSVAVELPRGVLENAGVFGPPHRGGAGAREGAGANPASQQNLRRTMPPRQPQRPPRLYVSRRSHRRGPTLHVTCTACSDPQVSPSVGSLSEAKA